MKNKHYLWCMALLCFGLSYAQEGLHQGQLSNPIPENFFTASPDVAAFQKYSTLPVSLYTGKINLSIPIHEIKSGNITIPISISYNSGGVKVDDFASSVGLNWNLNAGGSIVRMIKDLPDNGASFSLYAEYDWDNGLMLDSRLTAYGYNRKAAWDFQNYLTWGLNRHAVYIDNINYPAYSSSPFLGNIQNFPGFQDAREDLSPDIFNVNAPGLSSKFTSVNTSNYAIYPSNNNGFTNTFLDGSGAKIESLIVDRRTMNGVGFVSGTHYGRIMEPIKDFFEFNIVNNAGLKYKFADEEVSEHYYSPTNTQVGGNGAYGHMNARATMVSHNYSKKVHTWNLTSITDQKSNKSVSFTYDTYSNNNTVRNTYRQPKGVNYYAPYNSNECKFGFNMNVTAYSHVGEHQSLEKHIKRKRLKKIIYDEGEVEFVYGLARQDYTGENALTEVRVKDINGVVVKKYRFNYSYFISKENCSQAECKRLKLNSVDVVSTNNTYNSYTFDYEYSSALPKRGSLEQDYLGYYNHNNYVGSSDAKPRLYYYANQGIHSLLPFSRTNASGTYIQGDLTLTSNSFSLMGILKKVTYPTGGSSEFEYENHQFKFQGATYLGGGARVKSQTLKDNGVIVKKLEYEYKETDNSASGYMNNIPVYGFLEAYTLSTSTATFATYNKPKGGIELTSGSFVGYSRVLEKEVGKGYTEYKYSSPNSHPNTPEVRITGSHPTNTSHNNSSCIPKLISNSAYPSIAYTDNDYKRGKLLERKVYNNSNSLLVKEVNTFVPRILSSLTLQKDLNINAANEAFYVIDVSSSIPVAQDLQTQSVKTEYLSGGTTVTTNQTTYDASYPFPIETKLIDGSRTITSKFYYPHSSGTSSNAYMSNLRSQNRYSELVKFENYEGSQKLMTQLTNYDSFGGKYLPKSLSSSKGTSSFRTKGIIDQRDAKGNIIEVHSEDNVYTALIYGHNYTVLLAKIENATYSQVVAQLPVTVAHLQNLDSESDEGTLQSYFTTLRNNLPNAKVTSYTYKPSVGVSTLTDSRGKTVRYIYDEFNRLTLIKDSDDKIVKRYEYNYKNEQ